MGILAVVQLQTYILVLLPLVVVGQTNKTDNHRAEKALSVFTVVKFPNTACASGTSGRNGTCYTAYANAGSYDHVVIPGGQCAPTPGLTTPGQHMYIPASDQCNVLNANIGSSSTATTSALTIKVTQIECSSKTKAPNGCLQYFTEDTGTIETFNCNSAAGVLLVNQDYSSCVRTGRTYCAICYYSTIFKLSVPNSIAAIGGLGVDTNCGTASTTAYANAGSYDHVVIPGGQCAPTPG